MSTLEIEKKPGGILLVSLNRPESLNAINSHMMRDLLDLWQNIEEKTRCIILTGKGKAFSAGADLKERNGLSEKTWRAQHKILQQAMKAMISCPTPIIAAVNGPAFGGGLELLLGSDFAYASETATFGFPEVKLGIIPGAMGTQNLPRAAGIRRAKEICFTGTTFSAEQALECGVINKICAPDELMAAIFSVAEKICTNAPIAVRNVKKALNASQPDIIAGYKKELKYYNELLSTKDRLEGVAAFNEKRKPEFTGK